MKRRNSGFDSQGQNSSDHSLRVLFREQVSPLGQDLQGNPRALTLNESKGNPSVPSSGQKMDREGQAYGIAPRALGVPVCLESEYALNPGRVRKEFPVSTLRGLRDHRTGAREECLGQGHGAEEPCHPTGGPRTLGQLGGGCLENGGNVVSSGSQSWIDPKDPQGHHLTPKRSPNGEDGAYRMAHHEVWLLAFSSKKGPERAREGVRTQASVMGNPSAFPMTGQVWDEAAPPARSHLARDVAPGMARGRTPMQKKNQGRSGSEGAEVPVHAASLNRPDRLELWLTRVTLNRVEGRNHDFVPGTERSEFPERFAPIETRTRWREQKTTSLPRGRWESVSMTVT
jgi:hypothetical protein